MTIASGELVSCSKIVLFLYITSFYCYYDYAWPLPACFLICKCKLLVKTSFAFQVQPSHLRHRHYIIVIIIIATHIRLSAFSSVIAPDLQQHLF